LGNGEAFVEFYSKTRWESLSWCMLEKCGEHVSRESSPNGSISNQAQKVCIKNG